MNGGIAPGTPVLEIRGVTKAFGERQVLRGVDGASGNVAGGDEQVLDRAGGVRDAGQFHLGRDA